MTNHWLSKPLLAAKHVACFGVLLNWRAYRGLMHRHNSLKLFIIVLGCQHCLFLKSLIDDHRSVPSWQTPTITLYPLMIIDTVQLNLSHSNNDQSDNDINSHGCQSVFMVSMSFTLPSSIHGCQSVNFNGARLWGLIGAP